MRFEPLLKISNLTRDFSPLIHCITNYVTVNDCANVLLAIGASPVMADAKEEVEEFVSISSGLVLNLGTINARVANSMLLAGKKANELGVPVVLDPVGVGATKFRLETALQLLESVRFTAIRGNISELKTLTLGVGAVKGVDALEDDAVTETNIKAFGDILKPFAKRTESVLVATGALDLITDGESVLGVENGSPKMAKITGAGCMLSCVLCAYVSAVVKSQSPFSMLETAAAATCAFGFFGETAEMNYRGIGSFRSALLDAATVLSGDDLVNCAKIKRI